MKACVIIRNEDLHVTLVSNAAHFSTVQAVATAVLDAITIASSPPIEQSGRVVAAVKTLLNRRGDDGSLHFFWIQAEPKDVQHFMFFDFDETPSPLIGVAAGANGTSPYEWERTEELTLEAFTRHYGLAKSDPKPIKPPAEGTTTDADVIAAIRNKLAATASSQLAPAAPAAKPKAKK